MTHGEAVRTGAAERYLLEEMSEYERHAFENHYFSCLDCAEDVRAGGVMRAAVGAGLTEAEAPSPFRRTSDDVGTRTVARAASRPSRVSVVMPWAMAATLALALGYQSLMLPSQPGLQTQALVPVTLRPASRGADADVRLARDAQAVTLAVDLDAGSSAELVYDLLTSDDKTVASGRVAAPPPGTALLLLVPAATLVPSTRYLLVVRHGETNDLLGEFRFVVTAP